MAGDRQDSDQKTFGERIAWVRQQRRMSQDHLAKLVGMSQQGIVSIEKGEVARPRKLKEIAQFLDVDQDWLLSGKTPPGEEIPHRPLHFRPAPELLGNRDLPVYAAVEGGPGQMVVSTDPIELVPRPWYMREVRDGYAVLVVGDSMVPAFEPGQMAIVNPRLPPQRDTDVILVAGEHHGEFTASIKRLLGWTAAEWKLRQFNPQRQFTLSRREWPKALRVVGKYYGG